MSNYICIDIGGTSIKYGVLDGDARFQTSGDMDTEAISGGPSIMEKVFSIIEKYRDEYLPEGVCISTAGMVDWKNGEILYAAPHLIPEYTGMKIKKMVEERYRIPCEVENDVNCAGLAESFAGAAKDAGVSLCLTIGTGIGGAVIIDHKVFHGFSGSACEVGYMHLPGGAFQDLGASSILVKNVALEKGITDIDGKWIFNHAKAGDEICIRAIDEMADVLGMGIANICYVINPEIVVLGGGIMAQKEYLYGRIRKAMDKYLIPQVARATKLSFAENQNQAGMLGAFYNFKNRYDTRVKRPFDPTSYVL